MHLFSDSAITDNLKKADFSCTGSEFMTLAPMTQRYFERVVLPRGERVDNVSSLLAVLEALMLLISVKTGTVAADKLEAAIIKHLTLFQATCGDDLVRPKHHD